MTVREIDSIGSGGVDAITDSVPPSTTPGGPAVDVRGLTKRYGDGVVALDDVTLAFERGTITGLLGANGVGKTTLLKSILGLVVPTDGSVLVGGVDVFESPARVHGEVAAVFEGARNVYWRLTARENVALFARLHGLAANGRSKRVDRAVEAVGLADEGDAPVGDLSRGMKQRCALACALVREAPILVLDEPAAGLDGGSRADLVDLLTRLVERERRTILLSSHDMDLVEQVCERVVVVDDGSVVADATVAELRDAFATRTCSVTIDGEVDRERLRTVTRAFETSDCRLDRGRTRFEVVLPGSGDVYSLVDSLRTAGLPLRSIERAEPDLGSIFASISTDGGKPATEDA